MNLSRYFIDRPIFAGVLSILIFMAGLIAMFSLPVAEYPEVSQADPAQVAAIAKKLAGIV